MTTPARPSLVPTWGRGLLFAVGMTVVNATILVLINQTPDAPKERSTKERKIPIAFPAPVVKRTPPPPAPAALAPAALSELTPAPTAAAVTPTAVAPTLPALSLALPGIGTSGFGFSTSKALGEVSSLTKPTGATRQARPVRRPPPRYPRAAARRGLEGEVVVRVAVDARGDVTGVDIVRSTPSGIFDAAATAAARRYRFAPAQKNGVPVATTLEQRILFRVPK